MGITQPVPVGVGVSMLSPLVVIAALILCSLILALVVAFDTRRTLAGIDRYAWARSGFRRHVPNLATLLSRSGMTRPWPAQLTGLSIFRFRRKLRRLIKDETGLPEQLVEWHIGLWTHVHERLPLVEYALGNELDTAMRRLILALPEEQRTGHREQLELLRQRQARLKKTIEQRFGDHWLEDANALFAVLKILQVVFAEHGFHIHPDFARLRELEEALEPLSATQPPG